MTEIENVRTLSADCLVCGGKFSVTDEREAVWSAYETWNKRHSHPEAKDGHPGEPTGGGA